MRKTPLVVALLVLGALVVIWMPLQPLTKSANHAPPRQPKTVASCPSMKLGAAPSFKDKITKTATIMMTGIHNATFDTDLVGAGEMYYFTYQQQREEGQSENKGNVTLVAVNVTAGNVVFKAPLHQGQASLVEADDGHLLVLTSIDHNETNSTDLLQSYAPRTGSLKYNVTLPTPKDTCAESHETSLLQCYVGCRMIIYVIVCPLHNRTEYIPLAVESGGRITPPPWWLEFQWQYATAWEYSPPELLWQYRGPPNENPTATLFDWRTHTPLLTAKLGTRSSYQGFDSGYYIFLSHLGDENSGSVDLYNCSTKLLQHRVELLYAPFENVKAPPKISIDGTKVTLLSDDNLLVVLDIKNSAVVKMVPLGNQSESVVLAPERIATWQETVDGMQNYTLYSYPEGDFISRTVLVADTPIRAPKHLEGTNFVLDGSEEDIYSAQTGQRVFHSTESSLTVLPTVSKFILRYNVSTLEVYSYGV